MNRFAFLVVLALALTPLAAAAATSSLQQRLVGPGELTGYTPFGAKTLDLNGYASMGALDAPSKAKLAHAGFARAAVENLRPPSALPKEAGPSQSSTVEFHAASDATAFVRWLKKMYFNGPSHLPPGVRQEPLTVPDMPHAIGLHIWGHTSSGRLDEYDAILAQGRHLDEIDVYSGNSRLTLQQARAEFSAHFSRLNSN